MLPESLNVARLELHAGRSSQSTLNGGSDVTMESLYVSNSLLTGFPNVQKRVQLCSFPALPLPACAGA